MSQVARIEILQAEAARLMAEAQHDSLKNLVRLAVRDLDEGLRWTELAGGFLACRVGADCGHDMDLAAWRLAIGRNALAKFGADAMLLGYQPGS